jgi:hypothetical protein
MTDHPRTLSLGEFNSLPKWARATRSRYSPTALGTNCRRVLCSQTVEELGLTAAGR